MAAGGTAVFLPAVWRTRLRISAELQRCLCGTAEAGASVLLLPPTSLLLSERLQAVPAHAESSRSRRAGLSFGSLWIKTGLGCDTGANRGLFPTSLVNAEAVCSRFVKGKKSEIVDAEQADTC